MSIDDLTIGEVRKLASMFSQSNTVEPCPLPVGKNVFVRTVTYFFTGYLKSVTGGFLILEKAAWIADTGRFSDALASGVMGEVEPYPPNLPVFIGVGGLIDVVEWIGALPLVKK